jgi:hypothetical protein
MAVDGLTPREILGLPVVRDIVVGDFGRDAAVAYVRLAAEEERVLLRHHLDAAGLPFLDEYRRVMPYTLCDIAAFKRDAITRDAQTHGHLTDSVLVGLGGGAELTEEVFRNVTRSVIAQALLIASQGASHLRAAIPCNRLSDLAEYIDRKVGDTELIASVSHAIQCTPPQRAVSVVERLECIPVTRSVVDYVGRLGTDAVLLLGSAEVRELYQRECESRAINSLPITGATQRLIDELIVLSVGGHTAEVEQARQTLARDVVSPAKQDVAELVVVEACTDFTLGLGLSSLEVYATDMIERWYADLADGGRKR